mmetsp:Transcript_507/g.1044  ORF Transcript_507/g.1044 Transcript_507/m.1044 type:complete len:94 (-) Transcript_507:1205-1486(-)
MSKLCNWYLVERSRAKEVDALALAYCVMRCESDAMHHDGSTCVCTYTRVHDITTATKHDANDATKKFHLPTTPPCLPSLPLQHAGRQECRRSE